MDDSKLSHENVVEGETLQDTTLPNEANLVINFQNLINANLHEIASLEKELGLQKEMIESVLKNDTTYQEHESNAKEAARIKQNTKKEIFKRPDVRNSVAKLQELKANIKETKEELSNYIQEYARVSGQNYFEAEDGTIQEIVYTAKLRKKAV